jgi:selenocysteine lyase/cysteine desulfurase
MGCLYGKRELLIETTPQSHYFFDSTDTAHNLNPAGPNHESTAALAGIADYFEAMAGYHLDAPPNDLHGRVKAVFELIADHEQALAERFTDFAADKPGLRLIGPIVGDKTIRAPTFTFTVEGRASAEIPPLLLGDRVAIAHGNFYAPRLLGELGITDTKDGVVRASMAHYNTLNEVDLLIAGLDRIV